MCVCVCDASLLRVPTNALKAFVLLLNQHGTVTADMAQSQAAPPRVWSLKTRTFLLKSPLENENVL